MCTWGKETFRVQHSSWATKVQEDAWVKEHVIMVMIQNGEMNRINKNSWEEYCNGAWKHANVNQ